MGMGCCVNVDHLELRGSSSTTSSGSEEGRISVRNQTSYAARVSGEYEGTTIPQMWIQPGETKGISETIPGGTTVRLLLEVDLPGDVMPHVNAELTINGNMTVVIIGASNVVVEYQITGGP